jgi:uncharacterized damage-inducible protein DinB
VDYVVEVAMLTVMLKRDRERWGMSAGEAGWPFDHYPPRVPWRLRREPAKRSSDTCDRICETHPRTATEIVDAFHETWGVIEGCLERWTPDDLTVPIPQAGADRLTTRGWVIWHLMEHEAHHGGAISLVLGTNGLPGLDL